MIKANNQKGLAGRRLLIALAAFTLLPAGRADCLANSPGNVASDSASTIMQDQKKEISGTVLDSNGEPLVGVSVIEKGSMNGVITDSHGRFNITVKAGAVLQFSSIGYTDKEVVAAPGMRVTLEDDSELLSEVVVVGYGSQKRASLTGSIAVVDVEKTLDSRPIADVGRGLQGSVPGVNIRIPTGEVGSDPIINIRGQIGSISGNNNPLILLDNVEIPSIQMVNPDDIQSISVLKDAAASSIYGSKAAFGVILITSKTGAGKEKIEVTYSDNFSWQNTAKKIEIGGLGALKYTLDAQKNMGAAMPAGGFWRISPESYEKAVEWQKLYGGKVKDGDPVVYGRDWYYDGVNKYGYRLYDGAKAMIREWAPSQSHNLSISGTSGKTSYNVGLGYLRQSGMSRTAQHDDFTRYNSSISVTSNLNKFLSIRASSIFSDRNKRYPGVGTTVADPWLYLYRWSPLFPIGVKENGNDLREAAYELRAANTDNLRNRYFNVNLGATVNITKNWDVKFDYTYDQRTQEKNSSNPQFRGGQMWYSPTEWFGEDGSRVYVNEAGQIVDPSIDGSMPGYCFPVQDYFSNVTSTSITRYRYANTTNTINAYTTYNLILGSGGQHDIKIMAGLNRVATTWESVEASKTNLLNIDNPQFNTATGDQFASGNTNWDSQLGFFGRLNYSFGNRYFLEANIRRDGSSKFPSHLRWQTFPSFSGGWIFTNEKFMKKVEPVLSFGKIRASWGSIGDQSVANTLYLSTLSSSQSNWLDGSGNKTTQYGTPSLVDYDITWQRIETLDVGGDLRFWKNQIGITFDWFQRDTKNMIIPGEDLPVTLGTTAPRGNYGSLRTRGWELALDFGFRFQNGLGINGMATLSDAVTDITKGADWATPWENRLLSNAYSTGRRYGDIYGFVTDRLFQKDDFVYGPDGEIEKITVIYKGTARTTFKQSAKYPVYQVHYENSDKLIFAPGDTKFVDVDGDGYITPGDGTNGNPGDQVVIGNSTPRYEYGFRLGADWKGFDFSIFFQGIGKRKIWGSGQLAIPGYFAKEGALPKTFTKDYWTEDNTDAFYPRAWNLNGSDTGFSMQRQSRYMLNMAYLRIKNITLGYSVPERYLSKVKVSKARVYLSLENFFTFDHLRGLPIDPEAISGYSMFSTKYNMGRTGTGTPVFKSVSFGVQLSF